ncbi:MAG: hypothetical protein H7279_12545 [Microbacteriaceae bacterium]|nr:hypothetical protein [Microbacteriaceae bacterium]
MPVSAMKFYRVGASIPRIWARKGMLAALTFAIALVVATSVLTGHGKPLVAA